MGLFTAAKKDKKRHVTQADVAALYDTRESITDWLPVLDYEPEYKTFLLEDGISAAAMFEVIALPTEGRSEKYLANAEENIRNALTYGIPEKDRPYILQTIVEDELSIEEYGEDFEAYISDVNPKALQEPFTQDFVERFKKHVEMVGQPNGLFDDNEVTGARWGGKVRRIRVWLYRRVESLDDEIIGGSPQEELNADVEKFVTQAKESGVLIKRCGGKDYYYYMLEWFNPKYTRKQLREMAPYPGDGELPFGADLSTILMLSEPQSVAAGGYWKFDHLYHKTIVINGLRRKPIPGQFTAERKIADNLYAVYDRFPSGTKMCFTTEIRPQELVQNFLTVIKGGSKGDSAEAEEAADDAQRALKKMSDGDKLFPTIITLFLKASSEHELQQKHNACVALLTANGLHPIDARYDTLPHHTYIKQLPMNYEPAKEKDDRRQRLMFASDLAKLYPFYGRSKGTGNMGFPFFNRGGEPLTFDPMNKKDRKKNAFGVVLGPPGSGKSALMVYFLLVMTAIYKPRLFIIEKGNSFYLFAEHCKRFGLSVNQISLHPKNNVVLPPFADAFLMLDKEEERKKVLFAGYGGESSTPKNTLESFREEITTLYQEGEQLQTHVLLDLPIEEEEAEPEEEGEEEAEDERDYLGEMELAARVMITGGQEKEEQNMSRADWLIIRNAIVTASEKKRAILRGKEAANDPTICQEDRQIITSHVVDELRIISQNQALMQKRRERAEEMADSMALYTTGVPGFFFNRPGKSLPEADITILEVGLLAQEGYEDQLTLAFMSLMNQINAIVERDQYLDRITIVLVDEAHLILTNPMLAPYVVKIVKMWRKLGCWLWLATQNLADFKDASKKMLTMFEWWIAMTCPKEEIEHIARFKDLSEEQKEMLLQTYKEPGKYTEGVVMSQAITALLRNVPPSLALALAQTEKDEKTVRRKIMREQKCSEIEAAYMVEKQIDAYRLKSAA